MFGRALEHLVRARSPRPIRDPGGKPVLPAIGSQVLTGDGVIGTVVSIEQTAGQPRVHIRVLDAKGKTRVQRRKAWKLRAVA